MISIIIPTYNEEKTIKELLSSFPYHNNLEVIVADGGSCDRTVEFVQPYPIKLIHCQKNNKACQINEGVKVSRGDILLFLHADCILEEGALEAIEDCLSNGYAGGCLSQKINSEKYIYRLIETSGNIRAKLFKIFYGDQAIFVRRDIFFKIGGFDKLELFDDVIFSKKLNKIAKTCILNKKVYTSARRWEKQGIIKTTLINWILAAGFLLNISPSALKKIYFDVR